MRKSIKVKILYLLITALFAVTFCYGVFLNPNFNIYDFCMNLSSEILGLVIALVLVESYIKARQGGE